MNRYFLKTTAVLLLLAAVVLSCKKSTEPEVTTGSVQGIVKSLAQEGSTVIPSASVFENGTLLARSNDSGKYTVTDMEAGSHNLTCSALNYRDTTVQVLIEKGKTVVQDFYLKPQTATGRITGEFQDLHLLDILKTTDPSLADWGPQEVYDGVTGATLQAKTLGRDVPDRTVSISDSIWAYTDGWAQFRIILPAGTHVLTGSCEGYRSVTQTVTVEPDARHYVNFLLPRNP